MTAWGKLIATTGSLANTIGANQPFRYRGYVYDEETSWYYLQSRYYDPTTCRFISADVLLSTGQGVLGHNSFAYCLNNPLNRSDSEGNWSGWATLGLIVGAALCIAAVTVLTCGVGTATLAGAVAVGAAQGALIGAAAGTAIGAGVGYATTGTAEGALTGAAIGFGAGALVGAVIGGSVGANSWYSAKALEFTNNPGSSEVVLGRTGTYEKVATERSSTFFHTSEARWSEVENMTGVGRKGMWKINRTFLKQQISAGKSFVLANNPSTSGGILFQKEVKYLIKKGICYVILGE